MRLGIDCSNLRSGGGLTHLTNFLAAAKPAEHGIERVVLWTWSGLAEQLPRRNWLDLCPEAALDGSLPGRLRWQRQRLPKLAAGACDLLFAPGGNAPHAFSPLVTMSRNMLPFEYRELFRYGVSPTTLRLLLLRLGQARSFRRAQGLILLTEYAREKVLRQIGGHPRATVIPHGMEDRFRIELRPARELGDCSPSDPLRLLYVSIIDAYKHQWHVAEAVASLRRDGLPVAIDFVGPAYPPALRKLRKVVQRLDPRGEFLRIPGAVPHQELPEIYRRAELFVFASSCENMPNILLEAMAAGLPIACSERGPMPEVLGQAGLFFDPEAPASIARALRELALDGKRRAAAAEAAQHRAGLYSWERCARETLAFLRQVFEAESRRR